MPENCQRYRAWLSIEHHRLLAWAKAAGAIHGETEEEKALNLGINPLELMTILGRIEKSLRDFTELNERYKELKPQKNTIADRGRSSKIEDNIVENIERIPSLQLAYDKAKEKRDQVYGASHTGAWSSKVYEKTKSLVKRTRWVMRDETVYEDLLKDLHFYNERLQQLMDNHRSEEMLDLISKSYLEIVQTRQSSKDVKNLLEASNLISEYAQKSIEEPTSKDRYNILRDLTRLKYFNTSVETLKESELEQKLTNFHNLILQETGNERESAG